FTFALPRTGHGEVVGEFCNGVTLAREKRSPSKRAPRLRQAYCIALLLLLVTSRGRGLMACPSGHRLVYPLACCRLDPWTACCRARRLAGCLGRSWTERCRYCDPVRCAGPDGLAGPGRVTACCVGRPAGCPGRWWTARYRGR